MSQAFACERPCSLEYRLLLQAEEILRQSSCIILRVPVNSQQTTVCTAIEVINGIVSLQQACNADGSTQVSWEYDGCGGWRLVAIVTA